MTKINRLKNIFKFSISRLFFLFLGIGISLTFYTAFAAWNDPKNSSSLLSSSEWNAMVSVINGKVGTHTHGLTCNNVQVSNSFFGESPITATCATGTVTGGGCWTNSPGSDNIQVSRPSGNGWECGHNDDGATVWARCCNTN